jgi:hypothetical protein
MTRGRTRRGNTNSPFLPPPPHQLPHWINHCKPHHDVCKSYIRVAFQGQQQSQRAFIFQVRGDQGQFMKIRMGPDGGGQGTYGIVTGK